MSNGVLVLKMVLEYANIWPSHLFSLSLVNKELYEFIKQGRVRFEAKLERWTIKRYSDGSWERVLKRGGKPIGMRTLYHPPHQITDDFGVVSPTITDAIWAKSLYDKKSQLMEYARFNRDGSVACQKTKDGFDTGRVEYK